MPENISTTVEQEIQELEQKLAEKRTSLEQKKAKGLVETVPSDKDLLRETIKTNQIEKEPTTPGNSSANTSTADDDSNINQQNVPTTPSPPRASSLPSYLKDELKQKIQQLVNTAFEKSISGAVREAKSFHNPALLDAFHDALVDELYQHLLDRGKLKKI